MRGNTVPFLLGPALALLLASGASAQESIEIMSVLTGGDVVPNKVLTGAFGVATLTVNAQQSSVAFELSVLNLPSGLTGAHIHVGAPGLGGPVLFDLRPVPRQSGDIDVSGPLSTANLNTHPNLGIRDIDDAIESLIGLTTYIDVHTDGNPDGEVRGVLLPSGYDAAAAGARRTLRGLASLRR